MRMKVGEMTSVCVGSGCTRKPVAKNLCLMHYKRLHYRGSLERTKWDNRKRNPNYQRWRHLKRAYGMVDEWSSDFWAFCAAVGERPTARHRLFPLRNDELFGPENFAWIETLPYDFSNPEDERQYQRDLRKIDPTYERRQTLRRHGLTLDQYQALFKEQGGVCAMCKTPERTKRFGRVQHLCVDHDHETGRVRGLLCVNCNKVLGHAFDRPDILAAGALYLRNHRGRGL